VENKRVERRLIQESRREGNIREFLTNTSDFHVRLSNVALGNSNIGIVASNLVGWKT